MARIDLKHTSIYLQDGTAGTAALTDSPPVATATTMAIDTVVMTNASDADLVPVGTRFTVAGETATGTIHTITERTPAETSPTTNLTFTPALGAGTYLENGVVTFLPQRLEIKIGDGNLTYSETYNYDYELDRGTLDTVRAGDEAPLEVNVDAVYEFIAASSGGTLTPYECLKGTGEADEWVSSSSDQCEPYAIDVVVVYTPPCTGEDIETTIIPDFRVESIEVDYGGASLSLSGKCNATAPTVTRTAQ